jgi:hypothetical protein
MKRVLTWTVFTLALAACASPTPYRAGDDEHPGYRDQKLQEQRYRVSFNGNSVTPRETVEIYLLYRAAELTLAQQMDYFVVQKQDTDTKSEYTGTGPAFSAGFGRRRSFYSAGWGTSTVTESNRYEAIAYITMKKGKAPEDDPNAYDAREVTQNLESRIHRPKATK